MFLPIVVLGAIAMAYAGYWYGLGVKAIGWNYEENGKETLVYYFLPLLIAMAGSWLIGKVATRTGSIGQPWSAGLASVAWSVALVWGVHSQNIREWLQVLREGDANRLPWPSMAFAGIQLVVLALAMFQFLLPNILRIGYTTHRGRVLAQQSFAWFRGGTGEQVLRALESGDVSALAGLRTGGPTATRGTESSTTLMVSCCPGRPDLPSYLFLKDVVSTSAIYARQPRGQFGKVWLNDVRIEPDELLLLEKMVQGLVGSQPVVAGGLQGRQASRVRDILVVGLVPEVPSSSSVPLQFESMGGSTLRILPREAWRNLRRRYMLVSASMWLGLLGVPVIGLTGYHFEHHGRGLFDEGRFTVINGVLIAFAILLALTGVLLALMQKRIVRGVLLRAVRSRHGVSFPVDAACFAAAVEDARTYHKLKIVPDDFAIIRPVPGGVHVEMSHCSVRIALGDLKLVRVTGGTGNSLRWDCCFGDRTWSVVPMDLEDKQGLQAYGDPYARAQRLARRVGAGRD